MRENHLLLTAEYDLQTQKKLDQLYESLHRRGFTGTQTKHLPYHIPLGAFSLDSLEEVQERMKQAERELFAFPIDLAYLGLTGLRELFLSPGASYELLDLQQYFPGMLAEEIPWTPHTTLLIDTPEKILRAIPFLSGEFLRFTGYIVKLSLYELWPILFRKEILLADREEYSR